MSSLPEAGKIHLRLINPVIHLDIRIPSTNAKQQVILLAYSW